MSNILNISKCNVAQIIGEAHRFLFHVLLVHISTCIIKKDTNIFTDELFRSLLMTAMAIVMYHIFFRKLIEPHLEKMNLICFNGRKRHTEKVKLYKKNKHKVNITKNTYGRRKSKKRSISKKQ